MNVDKDGLWKDAIEQYLPLLLKRMLPELYEDVDFSQEFKFLDKELRDTIQVTLSEDHNAAKYVDTLVQIPLKYGKTQWVLLHIEVQGEGGEDISYRMESVKFSVYRHNFSQQLQAVFSINTQFCVQSHRMILYCCLIFAHYRRMPVALAILTDKRPLKETLGVFEYSEYGTELVYKYNLFEVYKQRDEELLDSDNPFDSFIYAAKKYSEYMSEDAQKVKLEYLLKIMRNLYGRGMNEQDRRRILIFISRLINLKDAEMVNQFVEELKRLEGESNMRELTWLEEHFRDEVLNRGRSEGIAIGEERTLKAAIDFMRSSGMSNEQIEVFRKSIK